MIYSTIKKAIPLSLKKRLIPLLRPNRLTLPKGKRYFVFLAADYGNIGDLAITAAQINFLHKIHGDGEVISVPISSTRQSLRSIRGQIARDDLVTIIGGGNMGSLYPDIEELRQLVIRSFPKNRIVCFPQTLDWDDSSTSDRALHEIVRIYSRHPDIHIFARESITRDKLVTLFHKHTNVTISYAPDIVMSTTSIELGATGNPTPIGILRCLRDDRESALDSIFHSRLDAALVSLNLPITVTDTHAGGSHLNNAQCSELLTGKIEQFQAARIIVTDRLHGMILAVLAGTPCLVLPNSNHKIRQTWQDWLRKNPTVIFLEPENFDILPDMLKKLLNLSSDRRGESPVEDDLYLNLKKALLHK